MDENKLADETEKGVKALSLDWPLHDSIYEIRIPRRIIYGNGTKKEVRSIEDYFEFLKRNIFTMIDKLENEAEISYWHILNHGEYLDLRIAIQSDQQKNITERIIENSEIGKLNINKWPKYKDKNLGSRLGCQALMRLFYAQSKFTREIVRSIEWIKNNIPKEETDHLINVLKYSVPIYTSHMQLNILPFHPVYEAFIHFDEGVSRFHNLVKGGMLPEEAEALLEQIRNANKELKKYIS